MEKLELNNIWEQIKGELITALPETAMPWIAPLEISGFDKGTLTVVTNQMMGKDILKREYYNQIVDVIKNCTNEKNADFIIIFDENATKNIKKETEKLQKKVQEQSLKNQAMDNLSYMQSASNLNLKYKFENYIVGETNDFAYKVAMAVAQNPGKKYNPLFIYGKSGLGKTHLMQAIGHYTIFNNSNLKVKYTKTEDYINDFITNSRFTKEQVENMSKFNKKYTNIDIILIDDIQFIEGKEKTMSQMQHTFDRLYNKGKQIVITSDRLPEDIPKIANALKTRFEEGIMIELIPPDTKLRFDILKTLAINNDIRYTDDALRYIADNFVNNIRELEGAFNKTCAYAEINNEILDINLVKKVLKCKNGESEIDFNTISKMTAEYFGVSVDDIMSSSRGQKITSARHIAIYLSRELTSKSFEILADYFKRKHSTIIFAHEKIKKDMNTNKDIAQAIREITQTLKLI